MESSSVGVMRHALKLYSEKMKEIEDNMVRTSSSFAFRTVFSLSATYQRSGIRQNRMSMCCVVGEAMLEVRCRQSPGY